MANALIVGSGPNGLAAAHVLASAGYSVHVVERSDHLGGGARSSTLPETGLLIDTCAAVHPMAVGSEFLQAFKFTEAEVQWKRADIDCAHPLDDGRAALIRTSIRATAAELGVDERRWRAMFEASAQNFAQLADSIMGPLARVPKHPITLARFGVTCLPTPAMNISLFKTETAKALYAGVAAHAFQPFNRPLVGAIGNGIIVGGHAGGWPVVAGGTGRLTAAILARLRAVGVTFETGTTVKSFEQVRGFDIVMYDLHPSAVAKIFDGVAPAGAIQRFRGFKRGPAAFKLDLAVAGGIPWTNEDVRRAGTVHLGGSAGEIANSERAITRGQMPDRPFVLIGQQYLADPQRADGQLKPVYAYAHVPHGFRGDATDAILGQIERFAPGARERIVELQSTSATAMAAKNLNFIGGDILTGAKTPLQLAAGPRLTLRPYDTGLRGHFICSAATPPGPGVHGMSGFHAAHRAIQEHQRRPDRRVL